MGTIVLFSGGVESTLMAQQAPKDAKLLTVTGPYDYLHGINPKAGLLANALGLQHITASYSVSEKLAPRPVHQIWWLAPMAQLVGWPDPDIWYGYFRRTELDMKVEREHGIDIEEIVAQWERALNIYPLIVPFDALSKQEQWSRIDPHLQPLVSSCMTGFRCGECWKCQEFHACCNPG